jgi:hypothetical protein
VNRQDQQQNEQRDRQAPWALSPEGQQLLDRARQLKLPAMPSTAELFALARRDARAAIRVLDDFGNWWAANVQELAEEKARDDPDWDDDDNDDPTSSAAYDDALYWFYRWRPDISREESRLRQFAWNLARTTRNPLPLRNAARQHWHWVWSDLDLGLRRRRMERRGAKFLPNLGGMVLPDRQRRLPRPRGAGRPRARPAARARSGDDDSDLADDPDPPVGGQLAAARRWWAA